MFFQEMLFINSSFNEGCNLLENITIPSSVEEIGANAFIEDSSSAQESLTSKLINDFISFFNK